jgi:hypothetical protein
MKIIKFTRTDGSPLYIIQDSISHFMLPDGDDNPLTKTLILASGYRHDVLEEIQDVLQMLQS